MPWILEHWEWFLIAFYVVEKVVKLSPAVWDDVLVDGIRAVLSKLGLYSPGL